MMDPVTGGIVGSAVGAGIGAIGSAISGNQSARAAERNYKHRYQWQMRDMKKAGLNPMLAFSQGAPNVPQPNIPDMGEAAVRGGSAGASAVQAARLTSAQVKNIEADTILKGSATALNVTNARESSIRAGISEASLPYAGQMAEVSALSQDRQFQIMGAQLEKLGFETGAAELSLRQQEQLMPLLVRAQQLVNQGMAADLVRKEVYGRLWSIVPDADTVDKVLGLIKDPLSIPDKIREYAKGRGYDTATYEKRRQSYR